MTEDYSMLQTLRTGSPGTLPLKRALRNSQLRTLV